MATQKETIEFILDKLGGSGRFSTRAMFGEYALYADGKVVGLVCNDQLYLKIFPASAELELICDKDEPYPGAKPYYLVQEEQLSTIENLPKILSDIAKSMPEKRVAKKKRVSK